jgi:hypothetical protein
MVLGILGIMDGLPGLEKVFNRDKIGKKPKSRNAKYMSVVMSWPRFPGNSRKQ